MKKIFMVTGELSGDKVGAWYIQKLREHEEDVMIQAVGGEFLERAGVTIYERLEKLNIVGVVEVLSRLPFIFKFLKQLTTYITQNNFDEVVLVDFPGFNLMLLKRLKKLHPHITVTYLSPPQLWVWGERRIKTIRQFCDRVVVIYPFEVAWYRERGVHAEWLGYPFCAQFQKYFENEVPREHKIALLPGSRTIEIKQLLPIFADVVKRFKRVHPKLKFVLPLAGSLKKDLVERMLRKTGLQRWGDDIIIVREEQEKFAQLSTCCLALSKPGTITLELALLQVPAVIAYRTSWISYWLAKLVVNITHMALPNLLLKKQLYPECIQSDCTPDIIFQKMNAIYREFARNEVCYRARVNACKSIKRLLCS